MNEPWIIAGAALGGAIVVGAAIGFLVRRWLQSDKRRPEVRAVAPSVGLFLFWFIVAVGVVLAVGTLSPESLELLPAQILAYLPRVLVAGLILIAGYALSVGASRVVGSSTERAAGRTPLRLTGLVRTAVMAAAAVLAIAQLGIDTTMITVVVVMVLGAVAVSAALLVGLGGRDVAAALAAGRYLERHLDVGLEIQVGDTVGTITTLQPATIEIALAAGGSQVVGYDVLLREGFTTTPS